MTTPGLSALCVTLLGALATSEVTQEHLFTVTSLRAGVGFGIPVDCSADLDGDGVSDLLIGGRATEQIVVASGRDGEILQVWTGPVGAQAWGSALAGLGDLDGDGTPDVAVGAPEAEEGRGRVVLLSGRDGSVLREWQGLTPGERMGWSLAAVDMPGRGPTLVVGSPRAESVTILPLGEDPTLVTTRLSGVGSLWGKRVREAPDLDGDGCPDVLVGGHQCLTAISVGKREVLFVDRRRVHAARACTDGLDDYATDMLAFPTNPLDAEPRILVSAPDLLGSGDIELLTAGTRELIWARCEADWDSSKGQFGRSLARIGDLDGDGQGDILVGAPASRPGGLVLAISSASSASGRALAELQGEVPGLAFGAHVAAGPDAADPGRAQVIVTSTSSLDWLILRSREKRMHSDIPDRVDVLELRVPPEKPGR